MKKISEKKQAFTEQLIRDSVYEAVLQVLSEYGLEKLTVQRVAAAANIGTGTLYNYFKDKDALLVYAAIRLFDQLRRRQSEAAEGVSSPLEKLQAFVEATFMFFDENVAYFRFLDQAQVYGKIDRAEKHDHVGHVIQMLVEIISQGVKNGDFKVLNIEKTANFFHRTIVGTLWINPELDLFDPHKEAVSLAKMFEIFLAKTPHEIE